MVSMLQSTVAKLTLRKSGEIRKNWSTMTPRTIKYGPGLAVRVYRFNGKRKTMIVEHGSIWRIWIRGYGWHTTY